MVTIANHFTLGDEELVSEWNQRKIPFSRTEFRRSCAILGTCGNIPDTQGSQRILLFAFICQGSGAQVEDQVEAVQKAPGSE